MSTEVRLSTRDPAPEKIQARHCDRHAVVYVRQSTLRQVEQNRESTRLQYGLADRACRLGWRRDQVVVIDDDLGRSGASTSDRPGFQRLVAEVGLGHVGLVLGIEVSRLARSRTASGIEQTFARCHPGPDPPRFSSGTDAAIGLRRGSWC